MTYEQLKINILISFMIAICGFMILIEGAAVNNFMVAISGLLIEVGALGLQVYTWWQRFKT